MNDRRKRATVSSGAEGNGFRLAISRPLLPIGLIVIFMGITMGEDTRIVIPSEAIEFLTRYGYLGQENKAFGGYTSNDAAINALVDFQAFNGLKITGTFTNETAHKMMEKRCGVPDILRSHLQGRSKRYLLHTGSPWSRNALTYKISSYPSRSMTKEEVDSEIARAFNAWAHVSSLTFEAQPDAEQVDINIQFSSFEHGDGYPFDGYSGILGHAFYPVYGGDAHFDDSETWTLDSMRGINLFQVALHEFGHSLGLEHSEDSSAAMAPSYRPYSHSFGLHPDDVAGIQSLYGPKPRPSNVPTRRPSWGREPPTRPHRVQPTRPHRRGEPTRPHRQEQPRISEPIQNDICTGEKLDAMFTSATGQIYAFRGDYVWELTENGVSNGYPKLIGEQWKGLPGNIDAAVTFPSGLMYFFKGSEYWRYRNFTMDGYFPRPMSMGFPNMASDLDAVFVWTRDNIIYFIKGKKFWKFDVVDGSLTIVQFIRPLSEFFKGLPENIDTAVTYEGETHVIKDREHYTYNANTDSFVKDHRSLFTPGSGFWSFGCQFRGRSIPYNRRH